MTFWKRQRERRAIADAEAERHTTEVSPACEAHTFGSRSDCLDCQKAKTEYNVTKIVWIDAPCKRVTCQHKLSQHGAAGCEAPGCQCDAMAFTEPLDEYRPPGISDAEWERRIGNLVEFAESDMERDRR